LLNYLLYAVDVTLLSAIDRALLNYLLSAVHRAL